MANENPLKEWMRENGLVMAVCDGEIVICDGDCENCEEQEEENVC